MQQILIINNNQILIKNRNNIPNMVLKYIISSKFKIFFTIIILFAIFSN